MSKTDSLKGENRKLLWSLIAANLVLLYVVIEYKSVATGNYRALLGGSASLIPAGLALVVSIVANGLLSSDVKAKLVFLRWHNVLPGHRAFSEHLHSDPRIDIQRITKACGNKLPHNAEEQNRVWYKFFKAVENHPSVAQAHRDFLLTRDYTALSYIFIVLFGGLALYEVPHERIVFGYLTFLIIQTILARQAATTYGVRFVRTVLAEKSVTKTK